MHLFDTLNNIRSNNKTNGQFIFISGSFSFLLCIAYFTLFYNTAISFKELNIDIPKVRSIAPHKNVVGEVKLRKQTSLVSQVPGVVRSITIHAGQYVEKNQLIAKLHNPEILHESIKISNQLAQLKNDSKLEAAQRKLVLFNKRSAIEKTKLKLYFEELKYAGKSELAKKGIVSSIDLQAAELKIKITEQDLNDIYQELELNQTIFNLEKSSASTKIQTLENQLLLAKEKVEQLNIYAPLSGRILKISKTIALGAYISSGELIADLYELQDLDIRLRVPPSTAKLFLIGFSTLIDIDGQQVLGNITFVENNVSNGATYVWVKTIEPLANLSSEGESVTAKVILPLKENILTVNKTDWYTGAGQYQLYCYQSEQLNACEVELGTADEHYIEVVSTHKANKGFEVSQNNYWLGKQRKVTN